MEKEKESPTGSSALPESQVKGDEAARDNAVPAPDEGHTATGATESTQQRQPDTQYVEGLPLLLVMAAVSIASFLVLLDTSIIATVSTHALPPSSRQRGHYTL